MNFIAPHSAFKEHNLPLKGIQLILFAHHSLSLPHPYSTSFSSWTPPCFLLPLGWHVNIVSSYYITSLHWNKHWGVGLDILPRKPSLTPSRLSCIPSQPSPIPDILYFYPNNTVPVQLIMSFTRPPEGREDVWLSYGLSPISSLEE